MNPMSVFLNAPAFPNDLAFHCRTFVSINSLRDELGNPLHEVDFRDELGGNVYSECPFSGSRKGKLMNQRALTEVTLSWNMITDDLQAILYGCSEHLRVNGLQLAWVTSLVPMFVPLYQLLQSNRNPRPLSLRSASLYKVMLDVSTTIDMYAMSNWPKYDQNISNWLGGFAEQNNFLVNGDYACAGSLAMIKRIAEILEGKKQDRPTEFEFGQLVYKFSNVMLAIYGVGIVFQTATAVLMHYGFRKIPSHARVALAPEVPSAYESRRQFFLRSISSRGLADVLQPIREWSLTPRLLELHPVCVRDVCDFYDYSIALAATAESMETPRDLLQLQRELELNLTALVKKLMLTASTEAEFEQNCCEELGFLKDSRMPGNQLAAIIQE